MLLYKNVYNVFNLYYKQCLNYIQMYIKYYNGKMSSKIL